MAQINSKTATYSIRLPLSDFAELKKAERDGVNFRKLTKIAVRHFIESGAINEMDIEKAA
jgi:hypothetical protein